MNSYELLIDLRERLTNGAMYVEDGTIEALDAAMDVMCGPVPDPETGLVPCGCGGKPMLANTGDPKYPVAVQCRQCYVSTDETCDIEHAVHDWNLAMGYRG